MENSMNRRDRSSQPLPSWVVESAIPNAVWPAIPKQNDLVKMSLLFQLQQTQWWTPEEIDRMQRRQLSVLVDLARQGSPWYRKRLRRLSFNPAEPIPDEVWQSIPILSREDIQRFGRELRVLRPGTQTKTRPIFMKTSGSSGRPVEILKTPLAQIYWRAITIRDHLWHERDPREVMATIRHMDGDRGKAPNGIRGGRWDGGFITKGEYGEHAMLALSTPVDKQVRWLEKVNPSYFMSYPSMLRELADHAQAHGWGIPNLKEIRTLSEMLTPETRAHIEGTFGVPVHDMYSCKEAGYMALQAPQGHHLLVQSEVAKVEILREDGTPCLPGEVGRVVVTPLHETQMPLLRYDVGDYAELGGPSPCGRGLPVLNRVMGRVRQLLTYPDGRRVWPTYMLPMEDRGPIRQYRVVQETVDQLTFQLSTYRDLSATEVEQLKKGIIERLGHPFDIRFEFLQAIPRTKSGKYLDFESKLPPPTFEKKK